jgi:2-dehydro-3-deoxyphosphogluconate aldolase/(4S)-4-hydroxy-2-oxoglutarate aldolase
MEAPTYLAEKNVACVGGSFASPSSLIEEKNWKEITKLAQRAASL